MNTAASEAGRLLVAARWAKSTDEERRAATAAATAANAARWEVLVDPRGELNPEERKRRAAEAKSEYFRQLGRRSGAARARRAAQAG